jgi:hypothetical protein
MQMPSLVKYFAFVGAALLGLISLANFLLEPSTGASMVQTAAKPAAPVVQHVPGASKIERWRNEQAALKATAQAQTAENASIAAKSTPEPVRSLVTQTAAAEPAVAQAPASQLQTQSASAQSAPAAEPDHAAEAERKAERAKAAKAAKKARLARERMRAQQAARAPGQYYSSAQQRTASNQQDAYYYGQRAPQYQNPSYAYAPRQSFGPFGW